MNEEPLIETKVNIPVKKIPIKMTREQVIRFQLLVYTHLNKIQMSTEGLNCLTLLGLIGQSELIVFCTELVNKRIFTSMQSARNALSRMEEKGLVVKMNQKKNSGRKRVQLSEPVDIITIGSILLQYNCLYIDDTYKS